MPDPLAIFSGIATGIEKASQNLMNIQMARYQIQREQENDKIERKYKEATIKKAEMELESAQLENEQNKRLHEDALNRVKGATSALSAISGFTMNQPNNVLSMGQAEGGEVVTPPGSTFSDGQIFDAQGNPAGEYLPGYEPKSATITPSAQATASAIGSIQGTNVNIPTYTEALQEGLPMGSAAKIGNYVIKSKKQEKEVED